MFESQQKPTGTSYTTTAALLAVALVVSPAVLIISRPFGRIALGFAIACSVLCLVLAWVNWKTSSRLSVPSLETPRGKAK
ncbi:MAG TPA: hypothetical protein VMJ34_03275 [Bryobacteraceae bacterium]|nr:hypothetical protein [Bryobacteraceae bacterium]